MKTIKLYLNETNEYAPRTHEQGIHDDGICAGSLRSYFNLGDRRSKLPRTIWLEISREPSAEAVRVELHDSYANGSYVLHDVRGYFKREGISWAGVVYVGMLGDWS